MREMKFKMPHTYLTFGPLCLAAVMLALVGSAAAQSQQQTAPSDAVSQTTPGEFPGGISIGATVSLLPFNVLASETITTTTSSPPSQTTVASNSTSGAAGAGLSVEIPLKGRIAFQTGFIFRSASYSAGSESVMGEDDEDTTDVDERTFTSSIERTRANYWDIPFVLRLYNSEDRTKSFRAFFQAGGSFRRASGIDSYRESVAADGSVSRLDTPVEPANRSIFGAVIGAGFRMRAAGRVSIVPELRYTRWFSPTFLNEPTRSSKNQVELMFGVTF